MERTKLMGFITFEYVCNHCGYEHNLHLSVDSFNKMTETETSYNGADFFVNTTCVSCHEHVEVSF